MHRAPHTTPHHRVKIEIYIRTLQTFKGATSREFVPLSDGFLRRTLINVPPLCIPLRCEYFATFTIENSAYIKIARAPHTTPHHLVKIEIKTLQTFKGATSREFVPLSDGFLRRTLINVPPLCIPLRCEYFATFTIEKSAYIKIARAPHTTPHHLVKIEIKTLQTFKGATSREFVPLSDGFLRRTLINVPPLCIPLRCEYFATFTIEKSAYIKIAPRTTHHPPPPCEN